MKSNGHSPGYTHLVRLLDKQEAQRVEIVRLRDRNLELELLLRSALIELAQHHEEIPSRFRREWNATHDPDVQRMKEALR